MSTDTPLHVRRPRGLTTPWASLIFVLVIIGLLAPSALQPISTSAAQGPAIEQTDRFAAPVLPADPADHHDQDAAAQALATFLGTTPATPASPVTYGAYASTPGGWSARIEPRTGEAARTFVQEAPQHDTLLLATLTQLRTMGATEFSGANERIYRLEGDFRADPAKRKQALDALAAQITDVRLAHSDRAHFKMKTITHATPDRRPDLVVEPVLEPQGDFMVITFDTGKWLKISLADGAPIIGMTDKTRLKHDPAFRERHERERAQAAAARQQDENRRDERATSTEGQFAIPASRVRVWEKLASCETGDRDGTDGDWEKDTGNGYYGGVQFSEKSWKWVGGTGLPHLRSKAEQMFRAEILLTRQGWAAGWPDCSARMGLRNVPTLSQATARAASHDVTVEQDVPQDARPVYVTVANRKNTGGASIGERMLSSARTKDGDTYRYGGEGKNKWDCSELTQWAARQAGVELPRTSGAQSQVYKGKNPLGIRIDGTGSLRPGDLVFYKYEGKIGHVGIYAGHGKVFAARSAKLPADQQIATSNLSTKNFSHGVRLGAAQRA